MIVLIALLAAPAGNAQCGIRFRVRRGWKVTVTHPRTNVCFMGVSPRNWSALVAKSRWPESDAAIDIAVTTDRDDALRRAGFFKGVDAQLSVSDGSRDARVHRITYGGMSGYEAEGFYRGSARAGANLGEESNLYSGTHHSVLLEREPGYFIVITYDDWSPDVKVDRLRAAKLILQSIRRVDPKK